MRILLDTHAFLWFEEDNPALSPIAKLHIMNGKNVRLLSIASVWEIAIKVKTGRLTFKKPNREFLEECLTHYKVDILPIDKHEAMNVCDLEYAVLANGQPHRDPFDRMIVSQSMSLNIPLISNEEVFEQYGIERIC